MRRERLVWLLYSVYALAAVAVVLYDVSTPVPAGGRSARFSVLTGPLTLPGWVLYTLAALATGIYPDLAEYVFTGTARAGLMILGCLGIPLLGAHLLHRAREWRQRSRR